MFYQRLKQFASRHETSLRALVLSALQLLLSRYVAVSATGAFGGGGSGDGDGAPSVVVGMLLPARGTGQASEPELAGVVGPFENAVPLRAELAGDPPVAVFLQRQREHPSSPRPRSCFRAGGRSNGLQCLVT